MNVTEEVRRLSESIDMHDLAGHYTTLNHWARREWAGPCPRCGGKDRFHVHADGWWKCYRCHPRRSRAVAFVAWAESCTFQEALDRLAGAAPWRLDARPASAQPGSRPEREPAPQNPRWQARAQRDAAAAAQRLAGPEGEDGRAYLAARGLRQVTWETWGLGFGWPWHPRLQERRPALVIPWRTAGRILAIQYRFLPGDEQGQPFSPGDRFSQKRGGIRTVYTCPSARLPSPDETAAERDRSARLVLVEGELNALSIWQALHGYPGPHARPPVFELGEVDVASFGSEAGVTTEPVRALAALYGGVVLWADRQERAAQGAAVLRAAGIRTVYVASPGGQDANSLLEAGLLERFLLGILVEDSAQVSRSVILDPRPR